MANIPLYPLDQDYIEIDNIRQRTLPPLPDGLLELSCNNNENLIELPELPDTLRFLFCEINPALRSLPELPNSLIQLVCSHNILDSLPTLPPNLEMLVCDDNRLTQLPQLPDTLIYLNCKKNPITHVNLNEFHGYNLTLSIDCEHLDLDSLRNIKNNLMKLEYCLSLVYKIDRRISELEFELELEQHKELAEVSAQTYNSRRLPPELWRNILSNFTQGRGKKRTNKKKTKKKRTIKKKTRKH
jgi:hypothetical protein